MDDLQDFARQPDGTFMIFGDMIIGDVVMAFPQAVSIMLRYGLHCVGCHASEFDTLEDGARGHGMSDEEIVGMISEINIAINKRIEDIEMTDLAVAKVKELRSQEAGKEDWPLRIVVNVQNGVFVYDMDFAQQKQEDVILVCQDLKVAVDQNSFPLLKGSTIDYIETLSASGFRIKNPNTTSQR
jgi:iron-sulfur cluster assembly accessory protein